MEKYYILVGEKNPGGSYGRIDPNAINVICKFFSDENQYYFRLEMNKYFSHWTVLKNQCVEIDPKRMIAEGLNIFVDEPHWALKEGVYKIIELRDSTRKYYSLVECSEEEISLRPFVTMSKLRHDGKVNRVVDENPAALNIAEMPLKLKDCTVEKSVLVPVSVPVKGSSMFTRLFYLVISLLNWCLYTPARQTVKPVGKILQFAICYGAVGFAAYQGWKLYNNENLWKSIPRVNIQWQQQEAEVNEEEVAS